MFRSDQYDRSIRYFQLNEDPKLSQNLLKSYLQTGVGRLLNKEVYKAAYPLHDGEYSYTEFAKDDPRRTSNIRRVKIS